MAERVDDLEKLPDDVLAAVNDARREMRTLRESDRFTTGHLVHFERLDSLALRRTVRGSAPVDGYNEDSRP